MSELIYSITLHGMPPSKKNSKRIVKNRRTKKPMLISSENYKQWENAATKQMGSDAWRAHQAAKRALDQFDLAHPSVVVELYEQFEAYQQAKVK